MKRYLPDGRDMTGTWQTRFFLPATNQYLNGQTVAVDGGYIVHTGSAA